MVRVSRKLLQDIITKHSVNQNIHTAKKAILDYFEEQYLMKPFPPAFSACFLIEPPTLLTWIMY
ncbi:MAG: hypothetical protein RIC06_04010 [Cyclobacteriaceae bacterium]